MYVIKKYCIVSRPRSYIDIRGEDVFFLIDYFSQLEYVPISLTTVIEYHTVCFCLDFKIFVSAYFKPPSIGVLQVISFIVKILSNAFLWSY